MYIQDFYCKYCTCVLCILLCNISAETWFMTNWNMWMNWTINTGTADILMAWLHMCTLTVNFLITACQSFENTTCHNTCSSYFFSQLIRHPHVWYEDHLLSTDNVLNILLKLTPPNYLLPLPPYMSAAIIHGNLQPQSPSSQVMLTKK